MDDNTTELLGYEGIRREFLPDLPLGTLRAMQSQGRLPRSITIGRRRYWERAVIEQWIADMLKDAS